MAEQLSSLIAQVRDTLQDPGARRWSDAVITQYLNEGQRVLSSLSFSLTSWASDVLAGADYITRPPGLLIPHQVFFRVGNDQWELIRRHGVPAIPNTVTGDPDSAYFAANLIYLRPVPNQNGELVVSGNQRITEMVAPTDTPFLEDCEPAIKAYALWLCFASDNDPAAGMWKNIFEQRRVEWSVLDASKNPQRSKIDRTWW